MRSHSHLHSTYFSCSLLIPLLKPDDPYSRYKLPWLTKIAELQDQGFTTAYSDGTGRELHAAAATVAASRRYTPPPPSHKYLGTLATVADAERQGILLSLRTLRHDHSVLLLSDCQAAIDTVTNLTKGQPPRSGIESEIKSLIQERNNSNHDTAISWVRAYVQIPGNEEADRLANWGSYSGATRGSTRTVTEGGLRAKGKQARAQLRSRQGFRLGTAIQFNRKALSAYTWMRTNKGPQRQWLHHIGKVDTPFCPCDSTTIQSGDHLTFSCRLLQQARRPLIGNRSTWTDLDLPRWIGEDPDNKEDGIELFFSTLFEYLTN